MINYSIFIFQNIIYYETSLIIKYFYNHPLLIVQHDRLQTFINENEIVKIIVDINDIYELS